MGAPRLYVVADRGVFQSDDEWINALAEVASRLGDGEALQVRVKSVRGDRRRDLIERARKAVALAAVPVFLNGTVEDATEFGYRAVHLPEANIARIERPLETTAASIHSFEALRAAEEAGVDFAVAGAVFAPGSHPGEGRGLEWLAGIARQTRVPVVAIGGITPATAPACIEAGAAGVAVVTGVMLAADRADAIDAYRKALAQATDRHLAGGIR